MDPQNGGIETSNTNYEGHAVYSCVSGYELDTGTLTLTRTCQLNGMWSGAPPQCVRKYSDQQMHHFTSIIIQPPEINTYKH